MIDTIAKGWFSLGAAQQDSLLLAGWLLPTVLALTLALVRYRVWPLVSALLTRHRGTAAVVILLIGLSVGLGIAVLAQERGLKAASAHAAEPFDLIVAAPGNDVTTTLASVFLQSANMPLLSPTVYAELAQHPNVRQVSPLAFGDSVGGMPLVGTTAEFVTHMSGEVAEGRLFESASEVVVGAATPFAIGDVVHPAHGHGSSADPEAHAGQALSVVGRLGSRGTPWDQAVIAPVETLWIIHGLGDGHAAGDRDRIGPPYDPARMPGMPAVLVRAETLIAHYALRAEFTAEDRMAFFPGEVLARLHGLLGDVSRVLQTMTLATQLLVVAAVAALLVVLLRGSAQRFAMLRALGAPRGFVFSVAFVYGGVLVVAGSAVGIALGRLTAALVARQVSALSAVQVRPQPALSDLSTVALFMLVGTVLAAVSAWMVSGRGVLADLRS